MAHTGSDFAFMLTQDLDSDACGTRADSIHNSACRDRNVALISSFHAARTVTSMGAFNRVSTKFISIFLFAAAVVFGQIAPPASEIFDKDAVHEIRLTFKQSDWYEQLTAIHTKFRD